MDTVLAFVFATVLAAGAIPLYTFVWGAGYQPVPKTSLEKMIEFARPGERDTVYDLGSGLGRIVLKVAEKCGSKCVGIEIDPLRCRWTKWEAMRRGLQDRVRIVRRNLLTADVSEADVVFLFLSPFLMQKVEKKLKRELKKGARIVSYSHHFKDWEPSAEDRETHVWLYET